MRVLTFFIFAITILLLNGCTVQSSPYKPDFNAINQLKDSNLKPMQVRNCSSDKNEVEQVSLRGSRMISPYGGTFSNYLQKSLEEHLISATLLDENSDLSISASLLKNEVRIAGFVTGEADLSANFVVYKKNKLVYNKTHTIVHQWESSFAGNVAIPNALQNYPIAMQKLINDFMEDKDFIQAVR